MRFPAFILWLISASLLCAQESSPAPVASPAPSTSPVASPSPSASPVASPSPSPVKNKGVKLLFLPPPMDGVFDLGIYDKSGKLVRVLCREAKVDDFAVAADGLITYWDGLDDAGQPLPKGTYRGRGFCVAIGVRKEPGPGSVSGQINFDTPEAAQGMIDEAYGKHAVLQQKIRLHLVGNPLDRDRAGDAEVTVGFDAKGSWLQLTDGLPLKQISATPKLKWAVLAPGAQPDTLAVFQSIGVWLEYFTITDATKMMAFDCGDFELDPQN